MRGQREAVRTTLPARADERCAARETSRANRSRALRDVREELRRGRPRGTGRRQRFARRSSKATTAVLRSTAIDGACAATSNRRTLGRREWPCGWPVPAAACVLLRGRARAGDDHLLRCAPVSRSRAQTLPLVPERVAAVDSRGHRSAEREHLGEPNTTQRVISKLHDSRLPPRSSEQRSAPMPLRGPFHEAPFHESTLTRSLSRNPRYTSHPSWALSRNPGSVSTPFEGLFHRRNRRLVRTSPLRASRWASSRRSWPWRVARSFRRGCPCPHRSTHRRDRRRCESR